MIDVFLQAIEKNKIIARAVHLGEMQFHNLFKKAYAMRRYALH